MRHDDSSLKMLCARLFKAQRLTAQPDDRKQAHPAEGKCDSICVQPFSRGMFRKFWLYARSRSHGSAAAHALGHIARSFSFLSQRCPGASAGSEQLQLSILGSLCFTRPPE